jgi:hypothetical protein
VEFAMEVLGTVSDRVTGIGVEVMPVALSAVSIGVSIKKIGITINNNLIISVSVYLTIIYHPHIRLLLFL